LLRKILFLLSLHPHQHGKRQKWYGKEVWKIEGRSTQTFALRKENGEELEKKGTRKLIFLEITALPDVLVITYVQPRRDGVGTNVRCSSSTHVGPIGY